MCMYLCTCLRLRLHVYAYTCAEHVHAHACALTQGMRVYAYEARRRTSKCTHITLPCIPCTGLVATTAAAAGVQISVRVYLCVSE